MNNIDRAAQVLMRHWGVAQIDGIPDDETECCAQALADAGLLAPTLPQPNLEHADYTDFGDVWIEHDEPQRIYIEMMPPSLSAQEAEALGLVLLAAAQHAKEQA